ncbi:glycoside hydrolase family 10 protein [Bergeyella zoohelcum]|uniref:Uncharacterized protein conserved in bacteria n=1 Tax=Bergeyella zoohelcum TaxID=1015 RepID=A0A7Z8YQ61_9FLAO|nr:family 10 glycosylhydrolase [Bergeyella zoohelcum]VDH05930.1 Uncharacterized protein conserved in bacteria [Bergeyella zoohelcum]
MKLVNIKHTFLLGSLAFGFMQCTVHTSSSKPKTTTTNNKISTHTQPVKKKNNTTNKVVNLPPKSAGTTPVKEKIASRSSTNSLSIPPKNEAYKTENNKRNSVQLPTIKREFRAVWIASVANINWPSRGNFSTEGQKSEAIKLLNMLQKANFNAVIFQIRPSADALYKSNYEPWSYFLTGKTGKAPSPYYDPLEFWIEEAHKRGMEIHVWLNPYRAHHTAAGAVTEESMVHKMGNKIVRLKNGMYWMDPADEAVQNHVSTVVKDIVKRYNIDAIHIDDYFYPYKDYNGGADFPDHTSWTNYQKRGGTLSRPDWRRANINQFIKRLHTEIKREKSFVKFGISPFGIWKPGYPAGIKGSSQYDELFADAKLWLNEGWCDYFSPQLYWKDGGAQSFSELLKWWQQENYKQIHLWPGLNTVALKGVADRTEEISSQIELTRTIVPKSPGAIHYSMYGLLKSPAMLQKVAQKYSDAALPPLSPWIPSIPMTAPKMSVQTAGNQYKVSWNKSDDAFHWVLFAQYGTQWEYTILTKNEIMAHYPKEKNGQALKGFALKKINRLAEESEATFWMP